MTHRERLLAAIRFKGPDRCPIEHYIFPGAIWRHGQRVLDLVKQYPDDFGNHSIEVNSQPLAESESGADVVEWIDAWGVTWRRLRGYTCGEVQRAAIPDWESWKNYQFPPPPPESHFADLAASVLVRKAAGEFVMGSGGGFFQLMQHLRGPEDYFIDLAEDNAGVHELADEMVKYNLHSIERQVQAGVDCIGFADDWGAQQALLIHPDHWRRFFKPRYARMFAPARENGIEIWFHTDGWILEIIDDLIEIGVTVLNPQHEIMDTQRVGQIVNGRCCIRTDIDRQWVIPFGTPDQIRDKVKEAIAAFGQHDGGVILHCEIGQDVPFANIEALYSAFYEFGNYPLDWL